MRGLYRVSQEIAQFRHDHSKDAGRIQMGHGKKKMKRRRKKPKKGRTELIKQGISAPIIGAAAENASLFMVYGKCQEAIVHFSPRVGGGLGIGELMIAGAGAGAVTSFVLYVFYLPLLSLSSLLPSTFSLSPPLLLVTSFPSIDAGRDVTCDLPYCIRREELIYRTPIELIKCRMQVQMLTREGALGAATTLTTPKPTPASTPITQSRPFSTSSILRQTPPPISTLSPPMGPIALISDTFRRQGIRGLWLGQTGTLLRETGGSAAWFGAYETSTRLFISQYKYQSKSDLSAWQLMLSGALAGISYNVTLFPADSIKSNMQTFAELNPGSPRTSFLETGKRIFKTRGFKGLYAGCGLTCLRSGPSSAMIFFLFQRLEQNFGYVFGLDSSEASGERSEVKAKVE